MAFEDDDFQAPFGLRTDEFLLRPIRASDAELDYEAVMESKEFLRLWEQTGWPEDDFTVEANRADLEKMARRFDDGESFAYTVMNPTETQCLGCVYIFPTSAPLFAKAEITALADAQWADFETAVYFWIRQSRLADGLDTRLLAALRAWLTHDWRIANHLFVTNEQFAQQVAVFEGALQRRFQLSFPTEPGKSLAFA